jgi:hypothetical protein
MRLIEVAAGEGDVRPIDVGESFDPSEHFVEAADLSKSIR